MNIILEKYTEIVNWAVGELVCISSKYSVYEENTSININYTCLCVTMLDLEFVYSTI